MTKVALIIAAVIFAAGTASATPIALAPDAVLGTSLGNTDVFDQLGIYVQTTSTDYIGNNLFGDVGHVAVTSLIPGGGVDEAGLESSWYFVGGWNDLKGFNSAPGQYVYTSGTLNLYATQTAYSFNTADLGANDDTGFTGTPVATLSLEDGTGFLTQVDGKYFGSINLNWTFTSIADGFWLDQYGNPISLEALQDGDNLTIVDANTDKVKFGTDAKRNTVIYSDHNGSVTVGVVPEPATMALFGTGLLGLAGAGIRRKFFV